MCPVRSVTYVPCRSLVFNLIVRWERTLLGAQKHNARFRQMHGNSACNIQWLPKPDFCNCVILAANEGFQASGLLTSRNREYRKSLGPDSQRPTQGVRAVLRWQILQSLRNGGIQMGNQVSRRKFLGIASALAVMPDTLGFVEAPPSNKLLSGEETPASYKTAGRIVDMHVHFDEEKSGFIGDLLKLSDRLNLTACVLTPFAHGKVVAEATKQHPAQIIPFGSVDLDASDVVKQVEELHSMGYRGLGELEFVRKAYNDSSYFPVYELANRYGWIVLFHTGIVLRKTFDEPEDVASGRIRPIYLEEIARRFPKITVLGAHCGNPEYEWAAEIARWNPNVFFDLSGSTLTKMHGRLAEFQRIFWWSGTKWGTKTPEDDPSAFVKLVFGSDEGLDGIAPALDQYRAMFDSCDVPVPTRKLILGGTLTK